MSGVDMPRTVSRCELLDAREQQWRQRLDLVSLAAEALDEIDVSHRDEALGALGDLYRGQYSTAERSKVLRRWPSVHVVATTGVAVDHYAGGTFWPKLTSLLGVSGGQAFHREWGGAFLNNLRRLGLPTFDSQDDDAGTKYVGRILMHSGMPTYCLPDFYRIVGERRSRVIGLYPAEFVSWAAARAAQKQLYNVDRPVARFLQYGGDFAVDVTERSFDLIDAVAAGGDGSDVPLPERFREVARQLQAQGEAIPVRRRHGRAGSDFDQQPRLAIDPFGQGLILRLPAVGDAPDGTAVWLVGLDDATHRVATKALFPGINEPAPQTDVPIPAPVRSATAALLGWEHLQAALMVVDDKDPLLAFGEDGLLIPAGMSLPAQPTWLLFPGDQGSLHVIGDAALRSESPLPPGWSGWCLVLVDLERASRLSVGEAGRSRDVRSQAAARVVAADPVPGVRTSTSLPVSAAVPTIHLPEHLNQAQWEVSVLDSAGNVLARWVKGSADSDPNSVWDSVPRPVVGTFTVRVRGPWGRGATRTVTVIEGLEVSFSPAWRRFAKDGLQACSARLQGADGVDVTRTCLEFDAQDREKYIRVGARTDFRSLVVTPPHMSIAYQSTEVTSSPSVKPIRLFREDVVEDPGTLILDVGASADPQLHYLSGPGPVQVIDPEAGRNGVYRFPLAKLVDTLAQHPLGHLALDPGGELVVATMRPRRLFSDVTSVDGVLQFADCVDLDGLTALVYPVRAPWNDPEAIPVIAGCAVLPDKLTDAGPLRVLVRVEDPWAPAPIPEWPLPGRSRLVEGQEYPRDQDAEATAVSAFLAGKGDLPTEVSDLSRLWTVRGLLGALSLDDRAAGVAAQIDAAMHASPRSALLAITASRVPSEAIPSLLVRAGLAWADLESAHDDTPPIWTARSALASALLSAADADWSQEEVEAASEVCGDVVSSLLAGEDPFAAAGRLDASADLFDSHPLMREEFVRRSGLVPTGLLSGDSRVLAAMEYVKARQDPRLEWQTRNARRLMNEIERLLRILDDRLAQTALAARRHPTPTQGWHLVPSISLGLAFAARRAARGSEVAARWLPGQARIWTDLAIVVPQMVTIDLIVAELLVAGSTNRQDQDA